MGRKFYPPPSCQKSPQLLKILKSIGLHNTGETKAGVLLLCVGPTPRHQKDIDALERVNRRAARVVHKKAYRQQDVSPTNLLKELGWQPLEKRREQQRLTMMYKISNGLVAVLLPSWSDQQEHLGDTAGSTQR